MAEGDSQDKDQKTEDPTHRRLEDARKKGQVPFSREIGSFLLLAALALIIVAYSPTMLRHTGLTLMPFLANAGDIPADRAGLGLVLSRLVYDGLGLVLVPLLAAVLVALAAGLGQNGVVISWEPIIPKLEKISPRKGLERMFSMRALVEFAKGMFKILVVGAVCYMAVKGDLHRVSTLPEVSLIAMLLMLAKLAGKVMVGVCIAMFFIALADLIYQRMDYMSNLRMSKQELKEEYKQQEGDPKIKQRLRQIRMERAKKRMMAAVPKADVVVTNPTHFAVALQYDRDSMQAPKVTAKGQDFIALTIRRVAAENNVPIVENPPLARTLFDTVEIDQEIPVQHYKAVAEIISYVYKLKGKK